MSSPIVKIRKTFLNSALVRTHQILSHHTRSYILSCIISEQIKSLFPKELLIKCLDVGCGDMKIAEMIRSKSPNTAWSCIDVHDLPDSLINEEQWNKYSKFDGVNLPFDDQSFDVILFCDVLHHDEKNIIKLIKEAARVGHFIIIKDHFEYGCYSRQMLRLMDFLGNWGYGVSVPSRYFNEIQFESLCSEAGCNEIRRIKNISLYEHIPILNTFFDYRLVKIANYIQLKLKK